MTPQESGKVWPWTIILKAGFKTLVDLEDYSYLNRFNWHTSTAGYACRNVIADGITHSILMARVILGLHYKDSRQVDHINGDRLDNRKINLRLVSEHQNHFNRKKYRGHKYTSKFKGVAWDSVAKKWRARLRFNNKDIHLGRFDNEINAAKAYDIKAKETFGDFASFNFPAEIRQRIEKERSQ